VLNQFAPTRAGFYLYYPQRCRFSQSFSQWHVLPKPPSELSFAQSRFLPDGVRL